MTWTFSWLTDWDKTWEAPFYQRWLSAFHPGSGARVSPFMHPAAVRAWAETFGTDGGEPVWLCAEHEDGREVLQILVQERRAFPGQISKVVRPLGADRFDFTEPVVFPGRQGRTTLGRDYWDSLTQEMYARHGEWFDRMEFPRVRASLLADIEPQGGVEKAPYLDLSQFSSIDDFLATRKGRSRRSLKRRVKRCYEAGDFSFQILGPNEVDRAVSWIPRIIAQKQEKFPDDTGLESFGALLTRFVAEGMPSGLVCSSSCSLDGRDISWSIDFALGDELFLYTAAFDPDFARFGVGNVHTYHQVDWAISKGMRLMNFMWGDESYKTEWTDHRAEPLDRITIENPRLASRLRFLADRVGRKLNLA